MAHSKSIDVVREWLNKEGKQTSVALASRSSLRAIPLFGAQSGNEKQINFSDEIELLALHVFRTNLVVWACSQPLGQQRDLAALAGNFRRELLTSLSAVTTSIAGQAAFAASDAAICANSEESDSAVAAVHAMQTVIAGTYASKSRITTLLADHQALLKGKLAVGV
jgi:uncharacterized membrane protein YadS